MGIERKDGGKSSLTSSSRRASSVDHAHCRISHGGTTGHTFRDVLDLVDATHKREVEDLQRKVSDLSKEVWRLRDSLREAQQQRNAAGLCAAIDEPHMREMTEEVAEALREEASHGLALLKHTNAFDDDLSDDTGELFHEALEDYCRAQDTRVETEFPRPQKLVQGPSSPQPSPRKSMRCTVAASSSKAHILEHPLAENSDDNWRLRPTSGAMLLWEGTDETMASPRDGHGKHSVHGIACNGDHLDPHAWIADMHLEPLVSRWLTLVDKLLVVAGSKRFYELREPWVQAEGFMSKVMMKYKKDQLDFHIFDPAPETRKTLRDSYLGVPLVEELTLANIKLKTRMAKTSLQCLVLDPQSPKRVAWMAIGMLLVVYDIVVVPMMVFPLPESSFSDCMKWISQLFWTLDILVTFFTGVYIDSELCLNLKVIAKTYVRSWLVMDLIVVVPLWVIELVEAVSGDSGGSTARNPTMFFRYFRFLRILRLVRIAKFEHYLQEALAAVNSSSLLLLVGIVKLMSIMIILNHLNACVWYFIGKNLPGGWVDRYEDTDIWYRYLTSMHWAITQFQGTSEIVPGMGGQKGLIERLYAVVTIIFALIFLSCFVSSLTNIMMQLESLREERTGLERAVRLYLSVNNISLGLSVRVKRYVEWKAINNTSNAGEKILDLLPKGLQVDVLTEVRGPRVTGHDFFNAMQRVHLRQFRTFCHEALESLQPAPDEWIFMPQDECLQMYFVIAGECRYIPVGRAHQQVGGRDSLFLHVMEETLSQAKNLSPQHLEDMPANQRPVPVLSGRWVSEAALWTPWEHAGALISVRDSMLLTLSVADFSRVMRSSPPAHVSAVLYARQFVAGLNRFGKTYTDIIDLESFRANAHD